MKSILSLFIISLISRFVCAQEVNILQHYSTRDGLSQANVTDICQDSKGYIWIGTNSGLNKFDGSVFKVYTKTGNNSKEISSSDIYKVFEDQAGRLWIGSSNGISLYNKKLDSFENFSFMTKERNSMSPARCIIDGFYKDAILIGSGGGLFEYNVKGLKFKYYSVSDSLDDDNSIVALQKDNNGYVWAALEGGGVKIFKYENGSFTSVNHILKLIRPIGNEKIFSLYADKENNIWMGSGNGILYKFDSDKLHLEAFPLPEKMKNEILSIIESKSGKLWLGTDKSGLYIFDKQTNTFNLLKYKSESSNRTINALCEDKKGNIWIGTYGLGIFMYDDLDNRFSFYKPYINLEESNKSNSVLCVCNDKQGDIWLGTDGGGLIKIPKMGNNIYFNQLIATPVSFNTVLSLLHSSDDKIYIGSYLDGLMVFDPKTNKSQKYNLNSPIRGTVSDNTIWAIFEDDKHIIWLASNTDGLVRFDPKEGSFKYFYNKIEDSSSLSDNSVRTIVQDSRRQLWIGTVNGLNKFIKETEKFSHYYNVVSDPSAISNNNITCIQVSTSDQLYIGTLGGGVNIFNPLSGKFQRIDESHGLISNVIGGIMEDEQGELWISTDRGISKYDPTLRTFNNFNADNGLYLSQFNPGAYLKTSDGVMYMGSLNGLCTFKPYCVRLNQYNPPVEITDVKVNNKPWKTYSKCAVSETDTLVLNYNQNFISLKYVALNFTHSINNRYAYKLEPMEKDWNFVGNTQIAIYTNLSPGKYTFKVKGSNNDGLWNEQPKEITIIIRPPFWKTVWFRGILVFFIMYALFKWYRMLRQRNAILEKLVEERTDEIQRMHNEVINSEKENARLIQLQLNGELIQKGEELSRITVAIMQKNRLLEELKEKLKMAIRNPKSMNIDDFRSILRTISLKFNTQKEWKEFDANFDLVHRNFIRSMKIKFPNLTEYDLRLCTLFRMNIPIREITDVLAISQDSLKKARYRLRKKLLLNPEDDLNDFLSNFN